MDILKTLSKLVVAVALPLQLAACAVMSKDECLNAEWRNVGFNVAYDGEVDQNRAFDLRQKACEKHHVIANLQQFSQGFSDGRVHFCQLENAVHLGVKGKTKTLRHNLCPEDLYPGFNTAFKTGQRLYNLNNQANQSRSDLRLVRESVNSARRDIRKINKKIRDSETTEDERNGLREERGQLRDQIYYSQDSIAFYEEQYLAHEKRVQRYADYLYNEYLVTLDSAFIDPRKPSRVVKKRENQTAFEDEIDVLLEY